MLRTWGGQLGGALSIRGFALNRKADDSNLEARNPQQTSQTLSPLSQSPMNPPKPPNPKTTNPQSSSSEHSKLRPQHVRTCHPTRRTELRRRPRKPSPAVICVVFFFFFLGGGGGGSSSTHGFSLGLSEYLFLFGFPWGF